MPNNSNNQSQFANQSTQRAWTGPNSTKLSKLLNIPPDISTLLEKTLSWMERLLPKMLVKPFKHTDLEILNSLDRKSVKHSFLPLKIQSQKTYSCIDILNLEQECEYKSIKLKILSIFLGYNLYRIYWNTPLLVL